MCSRSVRPSRRDPSGPPSGFCCSLKVFLTQLECQRSEGVTAVQVLKPSEAAAFVILCSSTDLIHHSGLVPKTCGWVFMHLCVSMHLCVLLCVFMHECVCICQVVGLLIGVCAVQPPLT